MGALFALFNTNELKNFELNWKDIEKTDYSLYAECRKMLQTCVEIMESIDNYQGAKEEIKLAMSSSQSAAADLSTEEKEALRSALEKVIPNAALCQSWMQFAQKLSKFLVRRLLPRLSAPIIEAMEDEAMEDPVPVPREEEEEENIDNNNNNEEEKKEMESVSELTILTHQALVRSFASMLDFLLSFDQKKMMKPQIQNDFSFYKRTLNKQNEEYLSDLEWSVSNEKAGFVSMFLAEKVVTMKEVAAQLALSPQSLKVLAIFCNACLDLLKENKFGKDDESQKLALRAMTSAFVIYDHGNTQFGAFQRKSDTKASKIVAMIANDYANIYGNKQHVEGLGNIIKYATAHYNDNNTPASIKNAFE